MWEKYTEFGCVKGRGRERQRKRENIQQQIIKVFLNQVLPHFIFLFFSQPFSPSSCPVSLSFRLILHTHTRSLSLNPTSFYFFHFISTYTPSFPLLSRSPCSLPAQPRRLPPCLFLFSLASSKTPRLAAPQQLHRIKTTFFEQQFLSLSR